MTKKTTLLQFFHWYYPDGGKLWQEAAERAEQIAGIGITDLWLPPAYKGASGGYSVGYDSYDLFDLGEFDQKGSRATKYGDKEALALAANRLRDNGVRVIYDVVFTCIRFLQRRRYPAAERLRQTSTLRLCSLPREQAEIHPGAPPCQSVAGCQSQP